MERSVIRRRLPVAVVSGVASLAFLSGCVSAKGGEDTPGLSTPPVTGQEQTEPLLRFTNRGGGSSIIQVYRGPSASAEDKESMGTYNSGDVRPIDCVTTGREVSTDTAVGEDAFTSDVWYRLKDNPGFYATQAYAEVVPPELEPSIKPCP